MARAFDGDGRPSVGMVAAWLVLLTLPDLAAAQRGEEIFASSCVACHTVGGGRLVGPDLEGVTERRSEEWLIRFIRSSQAVIASGDEDAVALSEAYPGLLMPDWALSDDEIRDVLTYIRTGADAGPQGPELPDEFTAAQVEHGRHLFQGTARLEGGGLPATHATTWSTTP